MDEVSQHAIVKQEVLTLYWWKVQAQILSLDCTGSECLRDWRSVLPVNLCLLAKDLLFCIEKSVVSVDSEVGEDGGASVLSYILLF